MGWIFFLLCALMVSHAMDETRSSQVGAPAITLQRVEITEA